MSSFLSFKFTYKMTLKQLNIKNRTYYFYNDLINIKDFDARLLKLDKKHQWVLVLKKNPEWNVNRVNPWNLMIIRTNGFIEEKNGDKHLNIAFKDGNSEVLKKYSELWDTIKDCIEKVNNTKLGEYDRYYIKIKFISDDDITLNKQLNFTSITAIIRNIFEKYGKYYPQIFLDESLYEV